MKATQRRLVLSTLVVAGALGAGAAYFYSLVPATHPDHDHGITNLDAGGRLMVQTRSGKERNLVGVPGKPLVVHFFSPEATGAAQELEGLFDFQKSAAAGDAEFVLVATKAKDFASLDAWLASESLTPPAPDTLVLDPDGETTLKLNCKRPLETMVFTADGKLSGQTKGPADWGSGAAALLAQARGGATIE